MSKCPDYTGEYPNNWWLDNHCVALYVPIQHSDAVAEYLKYLMQSKRKQPFLTPLDIRIKRATAMKKYRHRKAAGLIPPRP